MAREKIFKSFYHDKSMGAICCHGNQSSNPIMQPFPLPYNALHEI